MGIGGMEGGVGGNVISKWGKGVERGGEVDRVLVEKRGRISMGKGKGSGLYGVGGVEKDGLVEGCVVCCVWDDRGEGKCMIDLGGEEGVGMGRVNREGGEMIKFRGERKCWGMEVKDGREMGKGGLDGIGGIGVEGGNEFGKEREDMIEKI